MYVNHAIKKENFMMGIVQNVGQNIHKYGGL